MPICVNFTRLLSLVLLQLVTIDEVVPGSGVKAPKPDSDIPEEQNPPAYRIKVFAPNEVMAKSRFWYYALSEEDEEDYW